MVKQSPGSIHGVKGKHGTHGHVLDALYGGAVMAGGVSDVKRSQESLSSLAACEEEACVFLCSLDSTQALRP